ncbi:hypothetical protein [Terasakiella pusilla]|uniref:hypothetical protein n=1 Tax=Terasakiella pusilla TaxID=64973 RepID=UPI003AA9ABBE
MKRKRCELPEASPPLLGEIKNDLKQIATTTSSCTEIGDFERLYILAAVRRTLSLIVAFQQSIECGNEQMTATIIRLNRDTVARFYALFWADETQGLTAEIFAKKIFEGQELRKMRLRNGKEKATDRWLITQISGLGDWIESVYGSTCGAIHFSDFHMQRVLAQSQGREPQPDGSVKYHLVFGGTEAKAEPGAHPKLNQAFSHICMLLICAMKDRCGLLANG